MDVLTSKEVRVNILKPFKGEAIPKHLGDGLVVLGGPIWVFTRKRSFPG